MAADTNPKQVRSILGGAEKLDGSNVATWYYPKKAKEFEYRVTGFASYPDSNQFSLMLESLLQAIRPVCIASVVPGT